MGNEELAVLICDTLSDHYDDEEYREETEEELVEEISLLKKNSSLKAAIISLCQRIEELEME